MRGQTRDELQKDAFLIVDEMTGVVVMMIVRAQMLPVRARRDANRPLRASGMGVRTDRRAVDEDCLRSGSPLTAVSRRSHTTVSPQREIRIDVLKAT